MTEPGHNSGLRHVAVVLAGGSGSRIGAELPKQLLEVAGRPIIEHTIAAFQDAPDIDEIVVVMVPGHLDAVRDIVRAGGYSKVAQVVEGGGTRNASTRAALDALGDHECNVLLHDAARPLVTQTVIADVVAALATHEAVNTAVPSVDTVVQVHPGVPGEPDVIDTQLDRALLRRVQTPQAFRLSVIRDAYARAAADPHAVTTDDCTVVLRHRPDVDIALVSGDARNIKVTEPLDLVVAEQLLRD
jgi:2-C-methyl-D-erythritol 4-phosphate cytidylyltransferase